ncbi:MAG TPA: quinolinate synthase NadA [Candidatus Omnitrophota bacterium]|nr:quinolinate synthase NadA [Candidatus Omnitrophota bacterium]HPS36860.1 quinolinate synthase NadA [Candidatus Omnitrophota bacterium]
MTTYSQSSSEELLQQIVRFKKEREAVILAHNYQPPEIQDLADYTGDSLELSMIAAKTSAKVIVFCGVVFMGETAAILSPDKTVLLPVLEAGCTLADYATADEVRDMKKKHPGAIVVTYVNSSAEVKAETDICCTSANAIEIVNSIDPSRSVIFVSDYNLGHYAQKKTGRTVILWNGCCPTHALLSPFAILKARKQWPKARVIMHPECKPDVLELADFVGSTSGMLKYVKAQPAGTSFIVGTEVGLLHRLHKENPDKTFHPASDYLICPMMKMTTLKSVRDSLEKMQYRVTVPEDVRRKAKAAVDRMLEYTGSISKITK